MRKDWHKLFEDFFDDEQDIEVSQHDSIIREDDMNNYDHVFVMCYHYVKSEFGFFDATLLVIKKMIRYIEYILDKTNCIESHSPVILYSNNKKQVEDYPNIMQYKECGEFDTFNFAFGFNCNDGKHTAMSIISLIKKIIQVGYIEHFYANKLLSLKKGRDDYDNINTYTAFFDIDDNIERANTEGDFRSFNDFMYILKIMAEFTDKPLIAYNQLKKKYPKYAERFHKQFIISIMDEIRLQSAQYRQGSTDVVSKTNTILNKMKDCFRMEKIRTTKQRVCIYYRNTFIKNTGEFRVKSLKQTSGYSTMVPYNSDQNIFKDELQNYMADNNIIPDTILLKQYDNNTQMALIVYLGTFQFDGNLYDIAITAFGSTTVNNGVVNSEEEWKQLMLTLFDISENDFYTLWNKKKKSIW